MRVELFSFCVEKCFAPCTRIHNSDENTRERERERGASRHGCEYSRHILNSKIGKRELRERHSLVLLVFELGLRSTIAFRTDWASSVSTLSAFALRSPLAVPCLYTQYLLLWFINFNVCELTRARLCERESVCLCYLSQTMYVKTHCSAPAPHPMGPARYAFIGRACVCLSVRNGSLTFAVDAMTRWLKSAPSRLGPTSRQSKAPRPPSGTHKM